MKGIDLGTTTTCIAIYDGANANVLESSQSNPLAPSTVTVKGDTWQIGKHWPGDPKKGAFIYEAKRLIGRDLSERTLPKDIKRVPCFKLISTDSPGNPSIDELIDGLKAIGDGGLEIIDKVAHSSVLLEFLDNFFEDGIKEDSDCQFAAQKVLENPDDEVAVHIHQFFKLRPLFVHTQTFIEPEEISALLLRHCKRQIETRRDETVSKCTITVPAHFADSQRLATTDAARIAGWKDVSLVNEPTAAAVAHIYDRNLEDGCYLLPDLGGGTFDVSVLSALTDEEGQKVFVVKATGGDNLLGGANFTEVLMDIAKERGASISEERLKAACEQTKMELSVSSEALFEFDVTPDTISQEDFRLGCRELLDKISSTVIETLDSSGVLISKLRAVIMAGGASETVGFRDTIATVVGDVEIMTPLKPSQLCARGAALIASGKALITEVLSRSIGIALQDDTFSVIMHRASPLPLEGERTYFPSSLERPVKIILYEGEETTASENVPLGEFQVSGFKTLEDEFQVHIQVNEAREVKVRAILSGDTRGSLKASRKQKFSNQQLSAMASRCSQRCPISTIATPRLEDGQNKRAASPEGNQSKKLKTLSDFCGNA